MRPEVLGILPNIPSSIRAPTWDTTGSDRHLHPSSLRFNPRVPHGTRRGTYSSGRIPAAVSIHAPAEGATPQTSGCCQAPPSFNPRARGGRDSWSMATSRTRSCFNPRARGGRDFPPVDFIAILATFQSTRPRRARRAQGHASRPAGRVSIHAPAEGATHAPDRTTLIPDGFNPRARGGRDAAGPDRPPC